MKDELEDDLKHVTGTPDNFFVGKKFNLIVLHLFFTFTEQVVKLKF